jgi:hypothetical protein
MAQLTEGATPPAQVLVGVSPACSENIGLEKERLLRPIGSIATAPVLVIVSVTARGALVAPTATEPKANGPPVTVAVWPTAIAVPRRRRRTVAHKALFKIVGTLWDCIAVLLKLVGLVDYKFPGINQHHHQHAAGENIVGGDFALVVRVPHEGKTGFTAGRVRNRS